MKLGRYHNFLYHFSFHTLKFHAKNEKTKDSLLGLKIVWSYMERESSSLHPRLMEKVKEQGEHWESKTIENGLVSVGNKKAIGKVLYIYIYIFVIGPTQVVTNFWSFYFLLLWHMVWVGCANFWQIFKCQQPLLISLQIWHM